MTALTGIQRSVLDSLDQAGSLGFSTNQLHLARRAGRTVVALRRELPVLIDAGLIREDAYGSYEITPRGRHLLVSHKLAVA